MKTTTDYNAGKTAEWLNEAAQAGADYSSRVAARQIAFARKLAGQGQDFSWQKLFTVPADVSEVKQSVSDSVSASVSDYLAYARESVEDFAQVSDKHFDLLEQAVSGVAENNNALLPPQAQEFGRQWLNGVKSANAAVKDGIRTSCQIATEGLNQTFNGHGKSNGKANGASVVSKPAVRKTKK